jgi:hypothetical protein
MNDPKLDEVDAFKYLGFVISNGGSSTKEIKTRLEMTKLNAILGI